MESEGGDTIISNFQFPISNFRKRRGFTLVEMMIVVGVLAIIFGAAMVVFSQLVQIANRAHIANEVRDNASYALMEMVREIQKGERLDSISFPPDSLPVTNGSIVLWDSETNCQVGFVLSSIGILTCRGLVRDNDCNGSFGAGDDFLSSELVDITSLLFTRLTENKIRVEMTVEQCHLAAGTRPEYQGRIDLVKEVTLRNYAGYQ